MSDYYLFKKEKLNSFLRGLTKEFCLVAPISAENGDFLFQETAVPGRIVLNYDITSNTLKEFFFPAQETIFTYHKKNKGSVKIIAAKEKDKRETVFFGARSCDIQAVYFQDCFFNQEPEDFLYWHRRDRSILISLACNKPVRESCFCVHSQAGGPVLEKGQGFDLQFMDLKKVYLVEAGTDKGANLIKKYGRFFSRADNSMQEKKIYLKEKCLRQFSNQYNLMKLYKKLKNAQLQDLWEELGKRCTNCAGCEFICPTCFCFYAQDRELRPNKGKRIRAWDSCTFSGYSRMSAGVNPYEKDSSRISRRFFCKLYNCYNWFGLFACTGCGRCSFVCPMNLEMEGFIASLMRALKYQPLLKEL